MRQWQDFQVVDALIPDAYSGWTPVGFPTVTVGQTVWPIFDVNGNAVYLTTTQPRRRNGIATALGWLGDVNGHGLYVEGQARVVSTNPLKTVDMD